MRPENREALKQAVIGVAAVLLSGLAAYVFTDGSDTGRAVRFSVPLLVGMLAGGIIYFRQISRVENHLE
ncbi:MAG: hypothetical protein ABEJ95_03895 [Candidatus Nanohalobium sp.]